MNFRHVLITACLMLLGVVAVTAFTVNHNCASAQGPGRGPGVPPPGRPPGPPDAGFILRFLDLTDAQKAQIKAIQDAEDAKAEPYEKQIGDAHQALEAATAKGQFNESQIRTIAASEAQAMVELTVLRTRKDAAIYQVLTPEQRAKLDKFREEHQPPDGPGRPPRPPK